MTLYLQLYILLYHRFAFDVYNITHTFVPILLNHVLSPATPRFHGWCGTPYCTDHQKWSISTMSPWACSHSFPCQFFDFQVIICLGLDHHQDSVVVIIFFRSVWSTNLCDYKGSWWWACCNLSRGAGSVCNVLVRSATSIGISFRKHFRESWNMTLRHSKESWSMTLTGISSPLKTVQMSQGIWER